MHPPSTRPLADRTSSRRLSAPLSSISCGSSRLELAPFLAGWTVELELNVLRSHESMQIGRVPVCRANVSYQKVIASTLWIRASRCGIAGRVPAG